MTSKINALRAAALAAACSVLPMQAHADLFGDDAARIEIKKHRAQLKEINDRIESEIKNVSTRIDTGIEQLARRIDTKAEDAKVNLLFVELEKLRSELTAEVAKLRGQVEILNNELGKSQQKADKLTNDLANEVERVTNLHDSVEKRLGKLEPLLQTIDGVEYEVTKREQKIFDEASALLKKRDFTAAAKAFKAFLERFPGSGYSAQAYYLLGSSYLAAEDCKSAIPVLQTVTNRYDMTERASDAMLNLANCHDELDDQTSARSTLEALIKKYPKSPAAKTARARLKSLE